MKRSGHNVMINLGAHNAAVSEREENDYYATDPRAVGLLLERERFSPCVWEPACGEGHIARELERAGHTVYASDLIGRGYGAVRDFLEERESPPPFPDFDIVTNPPYKLALPFVRHALDLIGDGRKAAFFLKLQFLESVERRKLFDVSPPRAVYVASGRLRCAKNGDFAAARHANAISYAWFVWEKGYRGEPVLRWIN